MENENVQNERNGDKRVNKKFIDVVSGADLNTQSRPIIISSLLVSTLFSAIYSANHLGQVIYFLLFYGVIGYSDANGYHPPIDTYITNSANLAYLLQGALIFLLPICIIITQSTSKQKALLTKIICYMIAITYLFGNLWLLHWLYHGVHTGEWILSDFKHFQDSRCYIFNHMSWGYNSLISVIPNTANMILWSVFAFNLDRDYEKTYKYLLGILFFSFIFPAAVFGTRYMLGTMMPDRFMSGKDLLLQSGISIVKGEKKFWWFGKMVFLAFSLSSITFLFYYSSRNVSRYVENICEIRDRLNETMRESDIVMDVDADEIKGTHTVRKEEKEDTHHHHTHSGERHRERIKEHIDWTPVSERIESENKYKYYNNHISMEEIINNQTEEKEHKEFVGSADIRPSIGNTNRRDNHEKEFVGSAEISPTMKNNNRSNEQRDFKIDSQEHKKVAKSTTKKDDDFEKGDIVWISK